MNIFGSLYKEILLKYKNEQLGEILNSINNERVELNEQLFNLIHEDRHIINKYYNFQKGGHTGGQKGGQHGGLTQEEIEKMTKLKEILDKINQINPSDIQTNVDKIKEQTEKISNTITDFNVGLDIKDLFDKIPQKLNVIQTKLGATNTQNQLDIANQLRSLYVPFDNKNIEQNKIINTTQLNQKMDELKKSYTDLEDQIKTSTLQDQTIFDGNIEALKEKINSYIIELEKVKTELDGVNTTLEEKNNNFVKLSNFDFIKRENLIFVINGLTLLEMLKKYSASESASASESELDKTIVTEIITEYNKNTRLDINFILYYNEKINKLTKLEYKEGEKNMKLPRKLYTGSDTKAITNNMIKTDSTTQPQIMSSVGNLLKIKLDEFDGNTIKENRLEEIYNPKFSGGASIDDLRTLMSSLETNSKDYMKTYKSYVKNTQKYNKFVIYEITHSVYLLSILSNALFVKGSYQVYKYIGRGMINFYKRIIEKIYKDLQRNIDTFTSSEEELKNLTQEIRKKYFLTILILKGFLERLSQLLTPTDIIDIDECEPQILQYFTLLNHFKNILEKYNETQMNKLTIFSRVNDIEKTGDKISLDFDNYTNITKEMIRKKTENEEYFKTLEFNIDNKLFISDFLRRNLYIGYYIHQHQINLEDDNKFFDLSKNKLLNKELRIFPTDIELKENEPYNTDSKFLYTQQIYKFYEEIKKIFENNEINNIERIEQLEKYKKETLSIEIAKIFSDNNNNINRLNELENEINELQNKIDDYYEQIDDIMGNDSWGTPGKIRKVSEIIVLVEQKLYNNNTMTIEEYRKNKSEEIKKFDKSLNQKLAKDIIYIMYLMKIALDYCYAINSNVSEKLMWIRNQTCDAHKINCNVEDNINEIYNINKISDNKNKPKSCTLPEKIPYLNSYKFTEVFDTQNFVNNSDMAAYMCLNTRLSSGNGVSLITYGYSGTGKSYTLFGSATKDGLLQGTLNKLDGLEKIYFRTFEIYGKGLPYIDYWLKDDKTTNLNKIYNYLYAYKLKKDDTLEEKIRVELPITEPSIKTEKTDWAVELEDTEIVDYINKVNNIRTKQGSSLYKKTKNEKSDDLDYLILTKDEYQSVFKNFKIFTDKIEQMRIETQRVRETPNNKVSSRSILIYDFVLIINKDGNNIPVNFLIIDLPGREEIEPTFIKKYLDKNENPVMYNLIKNSFKDEINSDHVKKYINLKLYNQNEKLKETDIIAENYIKELKSMILSFILNPLTVPIFACEIIENFIKDNYNENYNLKKNIFEQKLDRKYKLYGEINNVFNGNTIDVSGKFKLLEEFYYFNYTQKMFADDLEISEWKTREGSIDSNIDINKVYEFLGITKDMFQSKLAWYTFNNILSIDIDGNIKEKQLLNGLVNNKLQDFELPDNITNWKVNKTLKKNTIVKNTYIQSKISEISVAYKFVYGMENNKYAGRQLKVLLFRNFIKRLIDLKRYDILNDLFKTIIDIKINYFIEKSINKSDFNCDDFIKNLKDKNFKRDALINKFTEEIINPADNTKQIKNIDFTNNTNFKLKFDVIHNTPTGKQYQKDIVKEISDITDKKNLLYESVKYDFYTTGLEALYINENIIGLIKYLGKDEVEIINTDGSKTKKYLIQSQTDREMIEINNQNEQNNYIKGINMTSLLSVSRMEFEGKTRQSITGEKSSITNYGIENLLQLENTDFSKYATLKEKIEKFNKDLKKKPITKPTGPNYLAGMKEKSAGKFDTQNLPKAYYYNNNTIAKLYNINISDLKFDDKDVTQLFIKDITSQKPIEQNKLRFNEKSLAGYEITSDYYYNMDAIENYYKKLLTSYESKKIYCYEEPIIKLILKPYLQAIDDFKIFYLFGNYEKQTRELKCAQQYELLETTNNFIEAITR
jgi:hypothetical protein